MLSLVRGILFAKRSAELAGFYRSALGLESVEVQDGWTLLRAGGFELGIHQVPEEVASGIVLRSPAEPRADVPIKLVFASGDLPGAMRSIREHGGSILRESSIRFDAMDLEGNVFQVHS